MTGIKLSFGARHDGKKALIVNVPFFVAPRAHAPLRRVGRDFIPGTKTTPASYPTTEEPYVTIAGTREGDRLKKQANREALWCLDKQTAAYCGVRYVPLEFMDGEWVPSKRKPRIQQGATNTS